MEYYHNLVTQKSWQELHKLSKLLDFVLIGGWAVFLYAKALKSKDIDIIVDFDKLSVLKKYYDVHRNDRLKKYEAVKGEVQIDIYLPHFSDIGIPIDVLISKTNDVEGFTLLDPNYLMLLKIYTLYQRGRSPKGRKDLLDILSLVMSKKVNIHEVNKLIDKYGFNTEMNTFLERLNESIKIEELGLNAHKYSKIKKDIRVSFS